jgi:uncharacterized membrane protein YbhN (UPF0104 family)
VIRLTRAHGRIGAMATARQPIGDRVERAIEHHADVAGEIERGAEPPPRGRLRRTAVWLAITGVSLYLVAPSVLEVLGSWQDITRFSPGWLAGMAALQGASLASLWALQRLALHMRRWRPVIASQLASNALSKIAPGGGALGTALQYRMLVAAGQPPAATVGALTTVNLLAFAVILAMPVLAVPALLRGGVDRNLLETAVIGLIVAAVGAAACTAMLAWDRPLRWVGRTVQRVRNRLRRHSAPAAGLPDRLLRERDRILDTLGPRWKRALAATAGRWAFDYATLLAALAAIGSHPRPGLVLLAFSGAQVLAQIPLTPGGLGFVEAGLSALLVLAGVSAGDAVLATFAYRLFSYWLPLPLGLVGLALQRRAVTARAAATSSPASPPPPS